MVERWSISAMVWGQTPGPVIASLPARPSWAVMVRLDRITTGTGDQGTTGLGDGTRLAKDHALICALGSIDEANCQLGLAAVALGPGDLGAAILAVQRRLFDLGADLAVPRPGQGPDRIPRIGPGHVAELEAAIEQGRSQLPPLAGFVLPGGCLAAAQLHIARAVVRRAERDLVAASHGQGPRPGGDCMVFLNRLSDLCFIWARLANDQGRQDVLWTAPGPAPPAPR